jgi:hypothetical protein
MAHRGGAVWSLVDPPGRLMAKRLTIFTIPGDPDELFEFKHAVMDPVITAKGAEYGELLHVAVRNPDGRGITIVNLWDSAEGSERAAQDPGTHYEVVDFIQR